MMSVFEPHWFWDEFVKNWEPHTFDVFRRYVQPGITVLDIGAWVGPTVLIAASLGAGRIVAVEANKTSYAELSRTVSFNVSLASKVNLINRCIHHAEGLIQFGNTDGSTSPSSAASVRGTGMQVHTITLGALLENAILLDVAFIKIDIEGSEIHIAQAIARLANHPSLRAIYLSLHPPFWPAMGSPEPLLDAMACFTAMTPEFRPISHSEVVARCRTDDLRPAWGTSFGNFFEVILHCKSSTFH
jgi:FkbM family methyltransferase